MTDTQRLEFRPTLHLAPAAAPAEQFQNETLRPLAKQQHDLLVAAFQLFLKKRKVNFNAIATTKRFDKVKELVARDNRLRGLLFGIVVGGFTRAEMNYYIENEGEVNRRLTNLLTERLLEVARQKPAL